MLQLQVSVGDRIVLGDIGVKLEMLGALAIHNSSSRKIFWGPQLYHDMNTHMCIYIHLFRFNLGREGSQSSDKSLSDCKGDTRV